MVDIVLVVRDAGDVSAILRTQAAYKPSHAVASKKHRSESFALFGISSHRGSSYRLLAGVESSAGIAFTADLRRVSRSLNSGKHWWTIVV
jgi:hypothetical protein